jgi:hypothetical protein
MVVCLFLPEHNILVKELLILDSSEEIVTQHSKINW